MVMSFNVPLGGHCILGPIRVIQVLKLSFTIKLTQKIIKLRNKTLSFPKIEDSNQNEGWDCAKGNSKGGNSNFLLNRV
jgi:hypothetical protein